MANNPELLKMPLARDGQKSAIPETTDASTGLFSQQYGWQSINSLPPQAGGKAVKREDFNGAFNLLGGIAFMAQKGFTFKWSAEQDYYAGCVVIDDTDGLRYECIADVTANSTVPSADATHWQIFSAGTDLDAWFRQASTVYAVGDMRCYESLPYGWYLECTTAGTTGSSDITIPSPLDVGDTVTDGTVVWTIRKIGNGDGFAIGDIKQISYNGTIQDGWLECDGRAVSRTMFADLFDKIGTTYGAGDGSTTFNLPDLTDRFIEGSTVAGTVKSAGLPNITGVTGCGESTYATGAFAVHSGEVAGYTQGTSAGTDRAVDFDASLSNPIYGASTTVQPNALTARYIIKAYDGVTPTPAEADISNIFAEIARLQLPTGTIIPTANDVASPGFLICDGSAVSRETYSVLFSAIGTKYGAGDGSTTFNLPDSDFVADKSDYVPVPVVYGDSSGGSSAVRGKQAVSFTLNNGYIITDMQAGTPSVFPSIPTSIVNVPLPDSYGLFADISSATATTAVKNQIKYS